jgi:hypothetical protein
MTNAFATWVEKEISEIHAWVHSVEKGKSRHHTISASGHREDITDIMLADKKQRMIELQGISVALRRAG